MYLLIIYLDWTIIEHIFIVLFKEHKELDAVKQRIQKRGEMIDELRKKHIGRAFPDRKLSKQLSQLQEIVKKLTQ